MLRSLKYGYIFNKPPVSSTYCKSMHQLWLSNKARRHRFFSSQQSDSVQHDQIDDEHYDIVISGGGMVGFAMACCLGQSKFMSDRRIIVLEGAPKKEWQLPQEYSNRVCALNRHTQHMFENLGIWKKIMKMRLQPVRRMQVWEACSDAMITFNENDEYSVAHIVENDVILNAIKSQVPAQVEVEYSSRVENYELPSNISSKVGIQLEGGRKLSADLLIGADGVKSLVRQRINSQYLTWEYDQMGIVATLQLSENQENTVAWQRFLPTGPVALLPLSGNRSSLVWSTTKENAKKLLNASDEEFTDALNRAILDESQMNQVVQSVHEKWMSVLDNFIRSDGADMKQLPPGITGIVPKSRGAFPLGFGHSVKYVAPRVALIGDAAHRVHPLAGQGVNLGFGDVDCLTTTLEESVFLGNDIGDHRELYRYESERQKYNIATMASIDGLYRLYTSTFLPFVMARSIGLSAVNAMAPVKNFFMNHAER